VRDVSGRSAHWRARSLLAAAAAVRGTGARRRPAASVKCSQPPVSSAPLLLLLYGQLQTRVYRLSRRATCRRRRDQLHMS